MSYSRRASINIPSDKLFFFCSFFKMSCLFPRNGIFSSLLKNKKKREKKKKRSWFCRDTDTNVVTSGAMTTRAQKRRIGVRDVWDVIVNNDDICFKHILPRLNRTDLKFLYDVNTETRKLIKRSSRASDLRERFRFEGEV